MATYITRLDQPGSGPRIAVKDVIDIAGVPTTAGCKAVAAMAEPAARDAACMAGARAASRPSSARPTCMSWRSAPPAAPVNLAGLPAIALPVPSAHRLPASIQLIGPANGEELLLATGALVESAVGQPRGGTRDFGPS